MTFQGVFRTVGPVTQRVHRGDWLFKGAVGVFPAPLTKALTHPLIGNAANDARRGHNVVAVVQGSSPDIPPMVYKIEQVQPIDGTGITFPWMGPDLDSIIKDDDE